MASVAIIHDEAAVSMCRKKNSALCHAAALHFTTIAIKSVSNVTLQLL